MATVTIHGNHARVGSGSDYWGKMHDPFDPRFAESVQNSLRGVVAQVKGDPWCLGYFVDNELSWGGFGDEGDATAGPGCSRPCPRRARPPSERSSNSSRKSTATSPGSTRPGSPASATGRRSTPPGNRPPATRPGRAAFKADLAAFVKELARTYFKTVRDQLKAADPDHLYLGCRFAWRTEEAVAAAAEFCDVVSFNIYDRRVDPSEMGVPERTWAAR